MAGLAGRVLSQSVPVLQRMRPSAFQIDEIVQMMRAKLLVLYERGRSPLMASYAAAAPSWAGCAPWPAEPR